MGMNILFLATGVVVGFVLDIMFGRKNRQGVEKGVNKVSDEYRKRMG